MSKVEIFVQVEEEIPELETVEKVLETAIKKEKLENVNFNLIIVDNPPLYILAYSIKWPPCSSYCISILCNVGNNDFFKLCDTSGCMLDNELWSACADRKITKTATLL